jgi:hypothetical protein
MTMAAASGEPFSVELEADEQGALWSWTRSAPGIKSPSCFRAGGASSMRRPRSRRCSTRTGREPKGPVMNDAGLVGARGASADAAGGPAAAARVDAARARRHFYWSASGRSWCGCTIKASSKLKANQSMSTRVLRTITLLVLTLASVPAALAQKVSHDWDRDVDFTPYRTYRWVDDLPGKSSTETTHKRILNVVDAQLQAKNIKKIADKNADLYVSYQVVVDANGQITSFNPDGQWQPGPGMKGDASEPPAGVTKKGALVIDLYDQKMKRLIWRGIVAGVFDSRQAVNYGIDKGLTKLFADFPP